MRGKVFGIICAILSMIVGAKDVETSLIAIEFGTTAYYISNGIMGFFFGVFVVTFLYNLGKVYRIAEAFARWFVIASISLIISAAYLVLQFYRIFGT